MKAIIATTTTKTLLDLHAKDLVRYDLRFSLHFINFVVCFFLKFNFFFVCLYVVCLAVIMRSPCQLIAAIIQKAASKSKTKRLQNDVRILNGKIVTYIYFVLCLFCYMNKM